MGAVMRRALVLGVALAALVAPPAPAAERQRTIEVVGNATLTIPNDLATFTFGVETRRPTASAALSATAVRVRSVIARMSSLGIAPADITTGNIDVSRVTPPPRPNGRAQLAGFVATNSVGVRVRDVASAGRVATEAVAAGATSVSGPQFSASDPGETARQALAAAFADAQAKAQRLAGAAGVDLGGPVSIQEGTRNSGTSPDQAAPEGAAPRTPPRVPPPVRPGNSTVSATVTVVFAID